MSQALPLPAVPMRTPVLQIDGVVPLRRRAGLAWRDLRDGVGLWRLVWALSWLDIKLRYRGSVLGPFWLTISSAVMIGALGVINASLFGMSLGELLPFLALSLLLWGFLSSIVNEACGVFMAQTGLIRSVRMPFSAHAMQNVVRNLLVLAHNLVVVVVVDVIFAVNPGWAGLAALPALLVWIVDAVAAGLLLGSLCARFRDIPPIIGSVLQIAFFISAIIWKPEQLHEQAWLLVFNPFFTLLEIVRGPLLGMLPGVWVWVSALGYSAALCAVSLALFTRVRGRLAFWV